MFAKPHVVFAEAPPAALAQPRGEAVAAVDAVAAPVKIVAVEIADVVSWELGRAALAEDALARPRDLQVKGVIAGDVVPVFPKNNALK